MSEFCSPFYEYDKYLLKIQPFFKLAESTSEYQFLINRLDEILLEFDGYDRETRCIYNKIEYNGIENNGGFILSSKTYILSLIIKLNEGLNVKFKIHSLPRSFNCVNIETFFVDDSDILLSSIGSNGSGPTFDFSLLNFTTAKEKAAAQSEIRKKFFVTFGDIKTLLYSNDYTRTFG